MSPEQVKAAAENLERRGYRVKVAQDPKDRRGYLAGDDASRAEAFNKMVKDPEVKAIFCLRGGYGSPRVLDLIDYGALQKSPKIIVGYSDATALLLAVRRRAGLVAFHGPMGKEWSATRGLSPYSERYFWECFTPESPLFASWGGERPAGMKAPATMVGGVAEGTLVGGNLSMISSTMGTPYEIDARDSILFLEEVSEKPFRIDRMINQLRLAGKLGQARGILLGGFTGCDIPDPDGDISLGEIFTDYFAPLGVPVLHDFPAGHVPDQVTLPLGARVRLDADRRALTILEPPVQKAEPSPSAHAPKSPPR
jgi:muramoyltetrapeptide carboxypeptidase